MLNPIAPLPLKDPTLFRQANCLDGKWTGADDGKTIVEFLPHTAELQQCCDPTLRILRETQIEFVPIIDQNHGPPQIERQRLLIRLHRE